MPTTRLPKQTSSARHHVSSACGQCRRSKIKVYSRLDFAYHAAVSDNIVSATDIIPPVDNAP